MDSPTLKVTVLLFAYLREIAGADQVALQLPEGSRLADIWPQLARQFPRFSGMSNSIAWAVNHAYAPPDQALRDGDVSAALPPVSGGSDRPGPTAHG
jgi:molybdopterin converting factor small subunit